MHDRDLDILETLRYSSRLFETFRSQKRHQFDEVEVVYGKDEVIHGKNEVHTRYFP